MPDLSRRRRDAKGRLLPRDGTEVVPDKKTCSRCEEEKPLADFPPDDRRIDGRMARCRACCAAVMNERRRDDPEAARAYDRSESRRARRNARLRERRKEDPDYATRMDAIREVRRQLSRSGITTDELYRRDEGVCHICGERVAREDAEPDHVVPLARGGANDPSNVRLSHSSCNRRKSDRLDFVGIAS